VLQCFDICRCSSITSSRITSSKIMSSIYQMLLICYALFKVFNMEFLINSHICSMKSSHFMEDNEISKRVSNLPKIIKDIVKLKFSLRLTLKLSFFKIFFFKILFI